jgi:hypothetical protein
MAMRACRREMANFRGSLASRSHSVPDYGFGYSTRRAAGKDFRRMTPGPANYKKDQQRPPTVTSITPKQGRIYSRAW